MEPSDLHGKFVAKATCPVHLVHPGPELPLVDHGVWPLSREKIGLWPEFTALRTTSGAG